MSTSDLARRTRAQQGTNQQVAHRAQELAGKVYAQRAGLAQALADRVGVERFMRAAATEIRTTKHLDECTDESILGALYISAQLGLEVGGPRGLVYLVPYRNSKSGKYEAQLIVGYKGWIDLFYRAGARSVQWFLIREGDQFRIGSDAVHGKVYSWEQADPNSTKRVTGAVAQLVTATGGIVWEYLSRADIEKRSTGTPFWNRWWDEMALKTVMRRLAATAPASTDLALAQQADETVQRRVEVPGLPAEHRVEHVPTQEITSTPAPQRRPAPPARAERQPLGADVDEVDFKGGDAPPAPDYPDDAEPDPEDEDEAAYEARMGREHDAWIAAQEQEGGQ